MGVKGLQAAQAISVAAHTHACTRMCAHTRTHHACTRSFGSVTQMHRWTRLPSRTLGCSRPCVPNTHLPTQSPAHAWEHSHRGQVPRSHLPLVSGGTELGSSQPHLFTSMTTLCGWPGWTEARPPPRVLQMRKPSLREGICPGFYPGSFLLPLTILPPPKGSKGL